MGVFKKIVVAGFITSALLSISACAPEVGSERWCKDMDEKPKGDWSVNEATDYTKHCLLK